jgi:hypothetical protein
VVWDHGTSAARTKQWNSIPIEIYRQLKLHMAEKDLDLGQALEQAISDLVATTPPKNAEISLYQQPLLERRFFAYAGGNTRIRSVLRDWPHPISR